MTTIVSYKAAGESVISIDEEGGRSIIPKDERNIDYRRYLEWVGSGNTPAPADPVSPLQTAPSLAEQILASPSDLAALKEALGL